MSTSPASRMVSVVDRAGILLGWPAIEVMKAENTPVPRRVAVVGSGIAGVSAAYLLNRYRPFQCRLSVAARTIAQQQENNVSVHHTA